MPRVAKQDTTEFAETDRPGVEVVSNGHKVVLIEVPLDVRPPSAFRIHIDCQLPSDSAMALRRIATALDKQQATLANGRRVVNATTAVIWLIEQVGAAAK